MIAYYTCTVLKAMYKQVDAYLLTIHIQYFTQYARHAAITR